MVSFDKAIVGPFEKIKATYDGGAEPLAEIKAVAVSSIALITERDVRDLCDGYVAYGEPLSEEGLTRPVRADLFITGKKQFSEMWDDMLSSLGKATLDVAAANAVVYSAIQSFAAAYDLCKRGARKTPGTYFEIIVGSLLSRIVAGERAKQVSLKVDGESVTIPTDIYFASRSLIVATKTSSRDRIIQPWSHQLLLDRLATKLALPAFRSILCMVGEVQLGRDEKRPCYPVCVPKQVKLYQEHVAQMSGLYYLDPPDAYLALSKAKVIPVRTIGELLSGDIP